MKGQDPVTVHISCPSTKHFSVIRREIGKKNNIRGEEKDYLLM